MNPPFTQQSSRSPTRNSIFGSATGNDFINTACTSVKIAVFAPIPSASVSTTVIAYPGDFRNWRKGTTISRIDLPYSLVLTQSTKLFVNQFPQNFQARSKTVGGTVGKVQPEATAKPCIQI